MKTLLLSFIFLFLITSVIAFGLENSNLPKLEAPTPAVITFNNATANVNSSDFWDDLNTPADILHSDLQNLNWFDSGHTMDTDLDMNSNDINEVNNLNVENDVDITDNLEVHGTTWIDEILNVTGITYLYNNLFLNGNNITAGTINLTEGIGSTTIDGRGYIIASDGETGFFNQDETRWIGFDVSGDAYDENIITCYNGSDGNCRFIDNVTTDDWFFGKFNWTSGDDWNIFDGSTLTFNESKLVGDFWFFYEEDLVSGTALGTLSLTQQYDDYDGISYNLTEAVPDGLEYYANTSANVTTDVNKICIRYIATGDDFDVSIWDISLDDWEGYMALTPNTDFAWKCVDIRDSADHLVDNKIMIKIVDAYSASVQHKLKIDAMYVSSGYTPRIGNEVDPIFGSWLLNPIFEHNINATNINYTSTGRVTASIGNFTTLFAGNVNVSGVLQDFSNNEYAKYQFTDNNFNGSGNFTTTGIGNFGELTTEFSVTVPNYDFSLGDQDWTKGTYWTISDGRARHSANGDGEIIQPNPVLNIIAGNYYKVTIVCYLGADDTISVSIGGAAYQGCGEGANTFYFKATNTGNLLIKYGSDEEEQEGNSIDDITITKWGPATIGSLQVSGLVMQNCIATGANAVALGSGTTASGPQSFAVGSSTTASGTYSMASGIGTSASGENSIALGRNSQATAFSAIAMGNTAIAGGIASVAMGILPTASADSAIAIGNRVTAENLHSISIGFYTNSSGYGSIAMGQGSSVETISALGDGSIAMGWSGFNPLIAGEARADLGAISMGIETQALGLANIAMGDTVISKTGDNVIAIGKDFNNTVDSSFAVGFGQTNFFVSDADAYINVSNAFTVYNNSGYGTGIAGKWAELSASDKSYSGKALDLLPSNPVDLINSETGKIKREYLTDNEKGIEYVTDFSRSELEEYEELVCSDVIVGWDEKEQLDIYEWICENKIKYRIIYPYKIPLEVTYIGGQSFTNKLMIVELKQENQMLKNELCLKDITYSWCK